MWMRAAPDRQEQHQQAWRVQRWDLIEIGLVKRHVLCVALSVQNAAR
jgi:hypothetical protein